MNTTDLSAPDELQGTGSMRSPVENAQRLKMIFSINGAKHKTTIDTIQKPIPKYPTQYSTINRTKTTRPEIRESQPQMPIVGFTNMFQRLQSGSTCSVCDK